ncbi:MAG: segregation/condensation protein A [Rhodospirillaceae bacterium]|nr:segregation/condensation protein A [Rhodospirillaceae bacterium]
MSTTAEAEFAADEPRPPETSVEEASAADRFVLALDGFEGPLDVLLALARDQKVDITRISILALAEQYLSFIQRAHDLKLDLAADYLVMAAWLAYLKSKLLLPQTRTADEPSAAEMAEALAFQLRRLEAVRDVVKRLMARPQKDVDFFARGAAEQLPVSTRVVYQVSLFDLLKAYGEQKRRQTGDILAIRERAEIYSVEDALRRLQTLIGRTPDWITLASYLPEGLAPGLNRRSAVAANFAATLELVKSGRAVVRQERPFGPIFIRRAEDRS